MAAILVSRGWDPRSMATDVFGESVRPKSPDAQAWSLVGAVHGSTRLPHVVIPTLAAMRKTLRVAGLPPSVRLFELDAEADRALKLIEATAARLTR